MDNEFENVEIDEAEIGLIEAGIEILSDITGVITGAVNVDDVNG